MGLFVLGITGLVLTAIFPVIFGFGGIFGSVGAILTGIGFLLLIRFRREGC